MDEKIMLSLPHMGGNEQKWINSAFADNWVVPLGPNVDEFEHLLDEYLGHGNVVALSSGTSAIHLGLVMLGVSKDDEVICQSLTFSASANPVVYCGATPVFVDSESQTWNMDPALLEEAIKDRIAKKGKAPKAIIVVHLYGMPAKMNEILAIAAKYDIPVLEDAAEGLGSTYKGRKAGTLGNYGALSFNGNKIITTSGGGALICPSDEAAAKVKFYATQSRENKPYYYHKELGFNYRMSNICAGIGCGQMEVLPERVNRRREIHNLYTTLLSDIEGITVHDNPSAEFDSNFWLSTLQIDPATGITPEELRLHLLSKNIEGRLLWRPMHMQPFYADAPSYQNGVSGELFDRGFCLPSGSILTDSQIKRVAAEIHNLFASK